MESGVGWGGVVDAAPGGAIAGLRSETRCGARDPASDAGGSSIDGICGELRPAAVLEPEIVDAWRGGLVGAVEHDQVAVVGVLDASNGEVEHSWADGCGEPPRDAPPEPAGCCCRDPAAEGDAPDHDSRSSTFGTGKAVATVVSFPTR